MQDGDALQVSGCRPRQGARESSRRETHSQAAELDPAEDPEREAVDGVGLVGRQQRLERLADGRRPEQAREVQREAPVGRHVLERQRAERERDDVRVACDGRERREEREWRSRRALDGGDDEDGEPEAEDGAGEDEQRQPA